MDITGRKLFVKALEEEGVDTIFGYPGELLRIYLMSYISRIPSEWFCRAMSRA